MGIIIRRVTIDMQKMIGDMVDPYKDGFQEEWRKSTFKLVPGELPPGMKCVIGIEGRPYQYETVMRICPVDPDDDILRMSNEGDNLDFVLILTYHADTKATDFTYRFHGSSWKNIYKFLNFMKAAVPENSLYVRIVEKNEDLVKVKLDNILFYEDYDSIEYNLELAKRIVIIENQYGLQFSTEQDISLDDIEMIYFLSDSIMGVPMEFTWESVSLTGNLKLLSTEGLSEDANFKYKEIANITILGQTISDLNVCADFESARIENLEEISAQVKAQRVEQIEIHLVPGRGGNHGTRIVEV